MPSVAWQPWHTTAFLDAQRRRRPILLLLETAWAPACADAHAAVFSRADVQQALEDRKLVERAKGILIKRAGLTEPDAFRRLQLLSSQKNKKMIEIARTIVEADEAFNA